MTSLWNMTIEYLIASVAMHPYVYLFIGLVFTGEAVLLPALYLGAKGILDTFLIFIIMVIATLVSDAIWYVVGFGMAKGAVLIPLSERKHRRIHQLSLLFSQRSVFFLFVSKFVYGTRTAVQILCGMNKMSLRTYFYINLIGVVSITAVHVAMMHVIVRVLNLNSDSIYAFQTGLAISVIAILLVHTIIGYSIKKKWFRQL